ncbi:MAG TPA: zinc metalloprotease [Nocardioidaceae bacterium]|nr:zinc metalloprotease [Nocardioidaceae bacterium]
MKHVLLGGIATIAMLSGGLVGPAMASTPVEHPANQKCVDKPSASAKVIKGTKGWRDLDTVTRRQAEAMESQGESLVARAGLDRTAPRPNGSVRIPVHFHVVTNKEGKGFVSRARILKQIKVFNHAYSGRTSPVASDTPFRFVLKSVSRTEKTRWYGANYLAERGKKRLNSMKQTLHVGDATHLNVYTVGFQNTGTLGYAKFPLFSLRAPKLDGVVLWDETLPGGNAQFEDEEGVLRYNQGDTGTHELGHWLNLFHTFQSSCMHPNDRVRDTPPQEIGENIFYCRANENTCGPRVDPKHNFMSYGDDVCLDRFTRGQRTRMDFGWSIRDALSSID